MIQSAGLRKLWYWLFVLDSGSAFHRRRTLWRHFFIESYFIWRRYQVVLDLVKKEPGSPTSSSMKSRPSWSIGPLHLTPYGRHPCLKTNSMELTVDDTHTYGWHRCYFLFSMGNPLYAISDMIWGLFEGIHWVYIVMSYTVGKLWNSAFQWNCRIWDIRGTRRCICVHKWAPLHLVNIIAIQYIPIVFSFLNIEWFEWVFY